MKYEHTPLTNDYQLLCKMYFVFTHFNIFKKTIAIEYDRDIAETGLGQINKK